MLTMESLRDAALQHLARYGTTRSNLIRVLDRRVERFVAQNNADEARDVLRQTVRAVVDRLTEEGLINDAAYGEMRMRRLRKAGRSHRAVAADLAARGLAGLTIPRDDELAAALATARRRRIGPFRPNPVDAEGARREIAMLARAGFPRDIVQTALQMASAAAESIVLQLKRR